MKKTLLYRILFLAFISSAHCLAQDTKFGKVSKEELEMTVYDKDPTASAVVLHEELNVYYEYDPRTTFKLVNKYFVRIKILTNEGLDIANQTISRYVENINANSELISGLTGSTYNLVNGKVEQVKLSKEHIFEEKTSENVSRTKFAFQSVKPGSVIEYRFELLSPLYWQLKDYYFQRSIPVKYSKYSLQIPEYFSFNKETKGIEPIETSTSNKNETMYIGSEKLNFIANIYDFVTKDLPGIRDEEYIWNKSDYFSRVTFELRSFTIPGVAYKDFSNSWEKVDELLLENSNFGKQLNIKPLEDLKIPITTEMTNLEKVRLIYNTVRSKVKWNDEKTFWIKNAKDALKKGLGTSGEINAILISTLREAGFDAYPVAMRLRSTGRIPMTHPTIDNFNYSIAAVDIDGKSVYMDASSKYGNLNIMSVDCLVDFSRSIRGENKSGWIDLTNITKNIGITNINAKFNENGEFLGKVQEVHNNQLAYSLRSIYSQSKDEQSFFDNIASIQNLEISSFSTNNIDNTNERVSIEYEFVKKDVVAGDEYIYLNPLILPIYEENPFKAEDRKLPVEFSIPFEKRYMISIDIPDGYKVEELPKSTEGAFNDKNDITYRYLISENKEIKKITLSFIFTLNRIVYFQDEYQALRDYFLFVSTNNNKQVVLKKITQ